MSDNAKQSGRQLALSIVNKINAAANRKPDPAPPQETPIIETSPLVEAIEALTKNRVDLSPLIEAVESTQTEALDVGPIVKAINDIELNFEVDLSALAEQLEAVAKRPVTDTKLIAGKLDKLVAAMDRNTNVLSELVTVAKATKTVTYDNLGRITEIKLK